MQKNAFLKPFLNKLLFFSITIFLILIDQFFKYKIRFFGGFYLCNKGISFGINVPNMLFWLILAIFLFSLLFFIYKNTFSSFIFNIGLVFFISGSLSNLLDRLVLGCVLDYISVFNKIFPVFNIADINISIGCFFIFISLFIKNPLKRWTNC